MKRSLRERLGDFVLGRGFYIALFLCIATIGISGYYLIQGAAKRMSAAEVNGAVSGVVIPEEAQEQIAAPTPETRSSTPAAPVPRPSAAAEPEETEPVLEEAEAEPAAAVPEAAAEAAAQDAEPAAQEAASEAREAAVFTWPVKGEILSGFSLEALAYDETMGDWRTHCGIDIAAPEGTRVLAVSEGEVLSVFQDELMGSCVLIDHGSGLSSLYCNLAQNPTVTVGDEVEPGTVIGAVGHSAIAESARAPHLHLEMQEGERSVDPVLYLP